MSDEGREATFERGVEVLAWNGVPIARAIEINGELQAGSNPDARFARGLDNLTIRPLNSTLAPGRSVGGHPLPREEWGDREPSRVLAGSQDL